MGPTGFGAASRDFLGSSFSGSSPSLSPYGGGSDDYSASTALHHAAAAAATAQQGNGGGGSRGSLAGLQGGAMPPPHGGAHLPLPTAYPHGSGRPPIGGGQGGAGHNFGFDRSVSTPQLYMLQQQQQQQQQQQPFVGRRSPRANGSGSGSQGPDASSVAAGRRGLYGVQSEQALASYAGQGYPAVGGMSADQVCVLRRADNPSAVLACCDARRSV